MKRYGYHRTSTREQHLDRGIKEITAYCEQNNLELEKIFTDQQTGKNFNRPRYQVLKEDVLRVRWSSIFVIFTLKKIIDWNISFQTVSCIHLMNGKYPKVCVNLQTGVRYNYSVWRFLLWQEEKVTHHRKQQCAK